LSDWLFGARVIVDVRDSHCALQLKVLSNRRPAGRIRPSSYICVAPNNELNNYYSSSVAPKV